MKYFDTHVHFFPDKLAGKALPRLREISQCPTYTDGTRGDTLAKFAQWGCVGGMVLHIATNAHQQTSVNRFAVESQGDGLYCFGSVYPYAENAIEAMGEEFSSNPAKNPPADVIAAGEYVQNLDTDTLAIYDEMWTRLKE